MRVFKNRWLSKFAAKQGISDSDLLEVIARANSGLIDADLGGGVIKQRIARPGQGKSGAYRSIVLFRQDDKAFFVYAFAKNERENISHEDLAAFKQAAAVYLRYTTEDLAVLIEQGTITELEP